jgi:hypothetical protein
MSDFDLALSIALGVGLAAATGFRVFLPMLIVSAAAYTGHLPLGENFAWLGTPSALIMLGVAALVEILAYYIPGVDNLLDTLATPAAVVAGTLVTAAVITDLPPIVKWTTAIIAGGGVAGVTQGVTALLRAKSTVLTGGIGNPVIATAELGGSLLLSLLALAAPLIAASGIDDLAFSLRTASTTSRIESITSCGCSICMLWLLWVLVMCLALGTSTARPSCADFCALSMTYPRLEGVSGGTTPSAIFDDQSEPERQPRAIREAWGGSVRRRRPDPCSRHSPIVPARGTRRDWPWTACLRFSRRPIPPVS